jgi:hypothetical protein
MGESKLIPAPLGTVQCPGVGSQDAVKVVSLGRQQLDTIWIPFHYSEDTLGWSNIQSLPYESSSGCLRLRAFSFCFDGTSVSAIFGCLNKEAKNKIEIYEMPS